ncbi:hypothetical protein P4O66_003492 [Electrophorus voltai]|uniref:Pyrin domain-containing protein n=1 Tax=Electrophorus voltai TaxID=2609070 RepID=A0AAD8YQ72_9TELE|nr:hypothetical protein P4O66_003492 [Electrophorus voltai]
MSNIPEQLLDFLEELVTTELKKFQWYLTNSVEDDKRIPKSQLENADRHDTVDKMVQKYGTFGAVNMTEVILKKMGNNQLAEKLRTSTRGSSPATSVKENIGYDTVAAAEKRIQKQSALKEVQRKWQQTIQEKEKKVQELKQAVDTLKRSAQAAVEDSEKIFNELIRSIKKKCCEVKELIRDREKIELSRAKGLLDQLEQEIADLKRRNPELEQLYHTEDHIHFLQKFQSLLVSSGSEDSTSIPVHQHLLFDGVKKSLSDLKERLEEFCMEEFNKIPPHVL